MDEATKNIAKLERLLARHREKRSRLDVIIKAAEDGLRAAYEAQIAKLGEKPAQG